MHYPAAALPPRVSTCCCHVALPLLRLGILSDSLPSPPAANTAVRYARALLDRELAVLLLSEAMLMADAEEAAREKQAAEEQLKKQR